MFFAVIVVSDGVLEQSCQWNLELLVKELAMKDIAACDVALHDVGHKFRWNAFGCHLFQEATALVVCFCTTVLPQL